MLHFEAFVCLKNKERDMLPVGLSYFTSRMAGLWSSAGVTEGAINTGATGSPETHIKTFVAKLFHRKSISANSTLVSFKNEDNVLSSPELTAQW